MKKLITILILLFPFSVFGQQEYGRAVFSSNINYTHSGLRLEINPMSPGVTGDHTGSAGDFEEWVEDVDCPKCPVGWGCTCGTRDDITSEDTFIFSKNTSVKLKTDGIYGNELSYQFTFEVGTAYQLTYCLLGETGAEDLSVYVCNTGYTDCYDFDTDAWPAWVEIAHTDVAMSWTCYNSYITTGVAEKTDYIVGFSELSPDGGYVYIDNVKIQELHSSQVVGNLTTQMSMPVTSDVEFNKSPELLTMIGTGPAGEYGARFDGVDDYLSRADDDSFDPRTWPTGGSFTVACEFMTDTIAAGTGTIINKYTVAGAQRSWSLRRAGDDVGLVVSNDGTNFTTVTKANVLGVDRLHKIVARYNFDGVNLSADADIYVDENAVGASAVMRGPPHNSTGNLTIGARGDVADFFDGIFGSCKIHEGYLSAIDVNKIRNPYFPGNNHGDGFYVDTCSQAASHATCSSQKCRNGTPNGCQAEGTGAEAIFGQYTELVDNNSFETLTGDDSDPDFADWTESEVPGDGTSEITAYRANTFHGNVAVRMTLTGTTSAALLRSDCMVGGIGSDVIVAWESNKRSGTADLRVRLYEHDDATCTSQIGYTNLRIGNIEGRWFPYDELFAAGSWDGTTASYEIGFYSYQSASDILIDTVSVKAASYHTPWVENPTGAGTTTYNARDYRLHNPLSDWVGSEGKYAWEDGFCASACVHSDWAGDDGVYHYILNIPGTAGNNNRLTLYKDSANNIWAGIYDAAGDVRYVLLALTGTNWTAGGRKFVEMCSNNTDDTIKGRWYNDPNSTWYTLGSLAGAGTGIQDGQSDELHVGHNGNALYLDGYFPGESINIVPYSDIFPQAGFQECVNFSRAVR